MEMRKYFIFLAACIVLSAIAVQAQAWTNSSANSYRIYDSNNATLLNVNSTYVYINTAFNATGYVGNATNATTGKTQYADVNDFSSANKSLSPAWYRDSQRSTAWSTSYAGSLGNGTVSITLGYQPVWADGITDGGSATELRNAWARGVYQNSTGTATIFTRPRYSTSSVGVNTTGSGVWAALYNNAGGAVVNVYISSTLTGLVLSFSIPSGIDASGVTFYSQGFAGR